MEKRIAMKMGYDISRPVELDEALWSDEVMEFMRDREIVFSISSFSLTLLQEDNVRRVQRYATNGIVLWINQTKGYNFLDDNGPHREGFRIWNQLLQCEALGIEPVYIYLDFEELRINDPAAGYTTEQQVLFVESVNALLSSINRLCNTIYGHGIPVIWYGSGYYSAGKDRYSMGTEAFDTISCQLFSPLNLLGCERSLSNTLDFASTRPTIPLVVVNGGYDANDVFHHTRIGETDFEYCIDISYILGMMMRMYNIDTFIVYGGVPNMEEWMPHFLAIEAGFSDPF